MRIQKRLAVLAMTLLLCCVFTVSAYAHEVPDMSEVGSISAKMLYENEAVGGGTLTLYRVGEVYADDGNYIFVLSDAFADSGVSLEDITDSELAYELADYANENALEGETIEIGEDGSWTASDLVLGLYLVVQYEAAEGFEVISPFLVSVPTYDEDAEIYIYDVSAEPKLGTLTEATPEPTAAPTVPKTSTTLPQTGQLNWPVPVLAIAGLTLFIVGWGLHSKDRSNSYAA